MALYKTPQEAAAAGVPFERDNVDFTGIANEIAASDPTFNSLSAGQKDIRTAEEFARRKASATSGLVPESPVSSTSIFRDAETNNKGIASEAMGKIDAFDKATTDALAGIAGMTTYDQTEAGKKALADLEAIRSGLGQFTVDETNRINAEAQAAGSAYDPLIADAQEKKRQGLPKAIIGGGEAGGFMNTQIAGAAALAPTEGGTFVGTGGELERIQSVYDRNIDNLRIAKQSAIAQARSAAQQAALTGKREDVQLMENAFEKARQAYNDQLSLAQEKIKALSAYQQFADKKAASKQGEIQLAIDDANKSFSLGLDAPEGSKQTLDAYYGPGFTDKLKQAHSDQGKALDQASALESAKNIVDILSKVPSNKTFAIGDTVYTGLKEVDAKNGLFSITETDASGRGTQVVTKFNPTTNKMEIVGSLDLGIIGKPQQSNGNSNDDKEIKAFQEDAAKLIGDIDTGKIGFTTAFDQLKTKYPQADGNAINAILGGGIPYDPITGKFDSTKAWGRAVAQK